MSARVVHFEIPFDDGDRARAFYADVFGWQISVMPELDYTTVTTGPSGDQGPTEPGYIGGGMFQRAANLAHPMVTLAVEDIDAALEQVVRHGGAVVEGRQPVGQMGFTGYFTDTEGNCVGLWQNA